MLELQMAYLIKLAVNLFAEGLPTCYGKKWQTQMAIQKQEIPIAKLNAAAQHQYVDFEILSLIIKLIELSNEVVHHPNALLSLELQEFMRLFKSNVVIDCRVLEFGT